MLKTRMSSFSRHLKTVARSMYLSFGVLPRPLRKPMGLAYMLCRAADTLTDGTLLPNAERRAHLARFKNLFHRFPLDSEAADAFSQDIATLQFTDVPGDQMLLQNLPACFRWLRECDLTDQALIAKVVNGVTEGMEMDLHLFAEDSDVPRALPTEADLERYLRSIGGEPGRFWAELSLSHISGLPVERREIWIQNGIEFGMGLQMVNILRDLPVDLKRGRSYVPATYLSQHELSVAELVAAPEISANEKKTDVVAPPQVSEQIEDRFRTLYVDLISSTKVRLLRGIDYLEKIPRHQWGMRAAVVWPMIIGLETLKRLKEKPAILNSKRRVKVDRMEIYRILAQTAVMVPFQGWLARKARSID
jgi:farnesyl-diphosphate farnesyltransferase